MRLKFLGRTAIGAALAWLCASASASAHDFWLQPERFHAATDAPIPFTLQVGHGSQRQRSQLTLRRIVRFGARAPGGAFLDLRPNLALGGDRSDGVVRLGRSGVYVLALQTDSAAQSHLSAPRFNEYLVAEGLTPALRQRERTGRTQADGSEPYSRQAKTIVQVGEAGSGAASAATARLGLPLEIVLEQNPYAHPRPQNLAVRVYYRGRPLPGALVNLTNLGDDAAPLETHRTGRDGRTRFSMPDQGGWLLNVIWTRPLPPGEETDFETIFSSLSFGFD